MQPFSFLLIALATFYTAYAVTSTHGPYGLFNWLRVHVPLGGLTTCIVCLSPWSAALLWLLTLTPLVFVVWILAAAGVSVFIYRYTGGGAL